MHYFRVLRHFLLRLFFLRYSFPSSSRDVADTCFTYWAGKKWVPFSRHHPLLTLSFQRQHEVYLMTEKQARRLQHIPCYSPDLRHATTMKETPRVCVDMKGKQRKICTVQTILWRV
jgi:hypothetical protein